MDEDLPTMTEMWVAMVAKDEVIQELVALVRELRDELAAARGVHPG
jgi:hypothetical protein